jgi:hypothetical protein
MNTWVKKLACGFLTVLILGTALFPSLALAQPNNGNGVPTSDQTQVATPTSNGYAQSQSGLPICVFNNYTEGTFEGCFVRLFYYAVLYPSAWIAGIAGQVFDYFIAYTLSSESYASGGFVEKGWKVLRDIANASFIFVLLYIAITFVLNSKTQGVLKLLTRVVLIAVVINFSLFFTRIIIDAGNIIARVFYEKIVVENDDLGSVNNYTTLSAGIMGYVKPQKILSNEIFSQNTLGLQNNTTNALGTIDAGTAASGEQIGSGFLILIILIAAGINLALAWIFFSVSIFFIGRTVGLWIMMIMSPIAFASVSIPILGSKMKRFGFNEWLKETAELSFMAVIFMFFLFLTIMFLDIAFDTAFNLGEGSTMQKIMAVIVPFGAVMFLLTIAKKQAKSMSGDFGDMVGKGLKYAVTGALGAAGLGLGVAAFAGRQTIGRAGIALANRAGTNTMAGRMAKRTGKYLSTSSFDARNVNIPKPIGSALKSGLSYATDGNVKDLNFGSGTTRGGIVDRRQAYVDRKIKDAKNLAPDEGTSVTVKDKQGKEVKTSVAEAKRNFERKKYEVQNDPANDYGNKKKEQEKQKKEFEKQEKLWKDAKKQKEEGVIDDAELKRVTDAYKKAKEDKEKADKDMKDVESKWKDEEHLSKEAESALGDKKSEHFRNYSDSIDSFDPRVRAGYASDSVEDLAYQQDKKNEANDKKNEKKDDK